MIKIDKDYNYSGKCIKTEINSYLNSLIDDYKLQVKSEGKYKGYQIKELLEAIRNSMRVEYD